MYYDIRTKEYAMRTLERVTGIPRIVWEINHRKGFDQNNDKFIDYMIDTYAPINKCRSCGDIYFVFIHITTSANKCLSIRKDGLIGLPAAYNSKYSELREFLDSKNVRINLLKHTLFYKNSEYDIQYDRENDYAVDDSDDSRYAESIGYRFFDDYNINGFFSEAGVATYGGMVHKRPEILSKIDELLRTEFSHEWELTHCPYEVTAVVKGKDICDDSVTDYDKWTRYIEKAYFYAIDGPEIEDPVLLNYNVTIPPQHIIGIKPLLDP